MRFDINITKEIGFKIDFDKRKEELKRKGKRYIGRERERERGYILNGGTHGPTVGTLC